jgi:hypothetical protein
MFSKLRLQKCVLVVLASGTFFAQLSIAQSESVEEPLPETSAPPAVLDEQTRQNVNAPCLEPPPLVRIEDYDGPMRKFVGFMARKLERRSIDDPHYRPNSLLCSLETSDKLRLFIGDTFDPISLLGIAYNSGLDQAQNFDPSFGQGAAGYAKRFAANLGSRTTTRFFTEFAYPTLFREDPRYYRLGQGNVSKRFWHAVGHAVITHRDSGHHGFNFSEWLGAGTGAAVSKAYHPDRENGLGPIAQGVAFTILTDVGFDVLREFWPELAKKFRMPFRGVNEPAPAKP